MEYHIELLECVEELSGLELLEAHYAVSEKIAEVEEHEWEDCDEYEGYFGHSKLKNEDFDDRQLNSLFVSVRESI